MNWSDKILTLSVSCIASIIVADALFGVSSFPVYVPISWAILVSVLSIWLGCFVLRLTLQAKAPIVVGPYAEWLDARLSKYLTGKIDRNEADGVARRVIKEGEKIFESKEPSTTNSSQGTNSRDDGKTTARKDVSLGKIVDEIDVKYIESWYKYISDDKLFPDEAKVLLRNLSQRLHRRIVALDKIQLAGKLADVLLLHLKEYRRALRRVEKGAAANVEEAYRCSHPGSRSQPAAEHSLHRLVTILAREYLQWELTSSLPCKLLLSILARKLLSTIQTVSRPNWIFAQLLSSLNSTPKENGTTTTLTKDGIVSMALGNGTRSATAAVIPRPLPRPKPASEPSSVESKPEGEKRDSSGNADRSSLTLEGLSVGHRGLWGDASISELDSEPDEDKLSPVYEEATDFATTIARLRSLLQQKSTVTTPLQAEEKSCVAYEGSQFTNLVIPWTEFYTAPDGSQQLLYCIQFDDVEQHGEDLFETTTATVRRQYSDFVQLRASLEEISAFAEIMSELTLPDGGRVEMENYLRTLCTRLSVDTPPQLRHFLRPSSGANKKADAVAPRLDRFLAKTVTGVFNTLKTVVPGFEMEQEEEVAPPPVPMPLSDIPWRFVEDVESKNLASDLGQLVAERIDYCSVDTAYEAVDSVEGSGDSELLAHWWETINTSYDEELDDLDSKLTLTRVTVDLACEVLAGTGSDNAFQREAVIRWTKLLLGNVIEPSIRNIVARAFDRSSDASFAFDERMNAEGSAEATKGTLLRLLNAKIPPAVKLFCGENDAREALTFLLGFLSFEKVNRDLSLQVLDILASQLLASHRANH